MNRGEYQKFLKALLTKLDDSALITLCLSLNDDEEPPYQI